MELSGLESRNLLSSFVCKSSTLACSIGNFFSERQLSGGPFNRADAFLNGAYFLCISQLLQYRTGHNADRAHRTSVKLDACVTTQLILQVLKLKARSTKVLRKIAKNRFESRIRGYILGSFFGLDDAAGQNAKQILFHKREQVQLKLVFFKSGYFESKITFYHSSHIREDRK